MFEAVDRLRPPANHGQHSDVDKGLHAVREALQYILRHSKSYDVQSKNSSDHVAMLRALQKSATNLVALYAVTSKQMRGRQLATDHSCKLLCCGKPNSATRTIRGQISNHAAPEKATHSVNIQIQIDIRAFARLVYHSNKDELTNSHEECRGATSSPPIPGSHSPLSSWDSRYTKLRRTLIMTKVPNPPLSRSVSAWPMSACGSVDLA